MAIVVRLALGTDTTTLSETVLCSRNCFTSASILIQEVSLLTVSTSCLRVIVETEVNIVGFQTGILDGEKEVIVDTFSTLIGSSARVLKTSREIIMFLAAVLVGDQIVTILALVATRVVGVAFTIVYISLDTEILGRVELSSVEAAETSHLSVTRLVLGIVVTVFDSRKTNTIVIGQHQSILATLAEICCSHGLCATTEVESEHSRGTDITVDVELRGTSIALVLNGS